MGVYVMESGQTILTRRQALSRVAGGFGLVGLSAASALASTTASPLAVRAPHFAPKAKRILFLFMNGGLSAVDSFDRKPTLDKWDDKPFPKGNPRGEFQTGNLMRSPFAFQPYGSNGIEVSELFPNLGKRIDEFCLIRSMVTDIPNHEPALIMMNNGHNQPGRPCMGSWLSYGLGTENQNLPGYIVLCPGTPIVGAPLWNSAFLPAVYQGTYINNKEADPKNIIQFIRNARVGAGDQKSQLALLESLNRMHQKQQNEGGSELEASIQSMETAFRMQVEAPEVFDIQKESEKTRARYGPGDFARGCLMALRLIEKGVRVVQLYFAGGNPWDHHGDIQGHRMLARLSDQPMAALMDDLKSRGLLEETLVVIGTEFGRTPVKQTGGKIQNGRDHNPHGFTVLLAGAGIKRGAVHGATDDFGFYAVENPVHVHDLHATILHLLGLDHKQLTYRYSGRDFRLTDVHGNIVTPILG